MQELLDSNSGVRSRWPSVIQFDYYTVDQMMEIAHILVKQEGMTLFKKAVTQLKKDHIGDAGNEWEEWEAAFEWAFCSFLNCLFVNIIMFFLVFEIQINNFKNQKSTKGPQRFREGPSQNGHAFVVQAESHERGVDHFRERGFRGIGAWLSWSFVQQFV